MNQDSKTKPPPIILGASGIAEPINEYASINWDKLLTLPPFQMFAIEKKLARVEDFIDTSAIGHIANDELYQEYCKWHEAKGYWKNETPMGELKNVS